jgi:hypothetical protein
MSFRWSVLLFVAACSSPPEEAPKEIGALSTWLFANFDGDQDELATGTAELQTFLAGTNPGDAELDDRSFTLPILKEADWGTISGPAGTDVNEQLPVAVVGLSSHDLQANIDLSGEKNHVCIESGSTKYYNRVFLSGDDCFADGSCDLLQTENEVRKETLIADVWYDLHKDYRRVVLEDGTEVMYARSWTEEVFPGDSGNNSWDQNFSLEAWIPDGKNTLRYFAIWSAVDIGIVGDDTLVNIVTDGIDEGYEHADAFMGGDSDCGNDRQREYDRP